MSEPTEEQLIRQVIAQITEQFKRDYDRAIAPYVDRLIEIELSKPVNLSATVGTIPTLVDGVQLISKKELDKII